MNVALITSISNGTPWANETIPNTLKYCNKHGYSFFIFNAPYADALELSALAVPLLDLYKYVWLVDADIVITNHDKKVEDLDIAEGLNVCIENLWQGNKLNCGSVILHGEKGKEALKAIKETKPEWQGMVFYWQQWLNEKTSTDSYIQRLCKIHPARTFNSCHHEAVNNWQEGDFVYHPCGAWTGKRIDMCKAAIAGIKQC